MEMEEDQAKMNAMLKIWQNSAILRAFSVWRDLLHNLEPIDLEDTPSINLDATSSAEARELGETLLTPYFDGDDNADFGSVSVMICFFECCFA